MKKRIISILLVITMVMSIAPTSNASGTAASTGVVLDKTATYDNVSNEGTITLSSYVKGSVESTPTDVVLVIDQSGSMWTAVNPDKKLNFSELDKQKGTRRGYYVAFSKNVGNSVLDNSTGKYIQNGNAHLMRYKGNQWEISAAMTSTVYEEGKFLGFINTIDNSDSWTPLTNQANYIYAQSISGALHDALNIFMKEMENAINCRVAVTTFAGKIVKSSTNPKEGTVLAKNSGTYPLEADRDYQGSGIFVDEVLTWDKTASAGLNKSSYTDAFEDPTTTIGKTTLKNTIDSINTNYGNTPTALGLLYARRLFLQTSRPDNTQKIAIVFTDGLPSPEYLGARGKEGNCTHKVNDYKTDSDTYDSQKVDCDYCALVQTGTDPKTYELRSTYVDQAKKLKDEGATVYSIGPSAGKAGIDVLQQMATSINHVYNVGGDNLSQVFQDIAGVIVAASQELNRDSVLVDELSESFELPKGTDADDIKVYKAPYTGTDSNGNDTFGERIELTDANVQIEGNTVKVSNFDYKGNAVFTAGDNKYGSKLIVEIPFTEKEDFLGGNNVLTNKSTAGIYNGDLCVKEFPMPTVDVDVKAISPVAHTANIYVGEAANLPHITNVGHFVYAENKNTTINSINNAYVDIEYVISDKPFDTSGNTEGNTLSYTLPAGSTYEGGYADETWTNSGLNQHPLLREDTTYYVKVSTTPITTGTCTAKFVTDEKTINVYKPHITFQDSEMNLGETANYDGIDSSNTVPQNYKNVVWKHGDTFADESTMGPAPILTYTYNPVEGAFNQDTPVMITKVVPSEASNASDYEHAVPEDQDIIKYATFYRNDCAFDNCEWGKSHSEKSIVEHLDSTGSTLKNSYTNFVVHIKTFDLTIKKEGANETLDPYQSFIFRVTGPNDFSMDVTILGNKSITITGLPVGEYSITELTDWSWRYEPQEGTQTITPENVNAGSANVTFTNSREENKWLSGDSVVENWFGIFEENTNQEGGQQ